MLIKNTSGRYGLLSITLHWVIAFGIFALFALGVWMVDLTYYDSWYQTAPNLHRSFGVVVVMLMVMRLGWRYLSPIPKPLMGHKPWERVLAHCAHALLYLLVISMFFTGYFITTAKGQGVEVFGWFTLPATITGVEGMESIAGDIHEWVAYAILAVVAIHAAGAVKHHFLDRDNTLKRMLGFSSN